jgi:hypothetical protein
MEAFVACGDAGEPLRVLSLYTDRYLGDVYARRGLVTENQYADLSRPTPAAPDERTELSRSRRSRRLPTAGSRRGGDPLPVIPPRSGFSSPSPGRRSMAIDDNLGELTFALP